MTRYILRKNNLATLFRKGKLNQLDLENYFAQIVIVTYDQHIA